MSREYLSIGSTPSEEAAAQVGSDNFTSRSYAECRAYIGQLRRELGPEPDGALLAVKSFPHDFGTYREVVCWYDDTNQATVDYAFRAEAANVQWWDAAARNELLAAGIWIDTLANRQMPRQPRAKQ